MSRTRPRSSKAFTVALRHRGEAASQRRPAARLHGRHGGGDPVQVVCGAPNARTGMKSVFSPPGTYIPGKKITLGKGVIRGVEVERHAVLGGRARALRGSRRHHRTARRRAGRRSLMRNMPGSTIRSSRSTVTPNRPDAAGVARHRARSRRGGARQAEERRRSPPVAGQVPLPVARDARFRARRQASLPGLRLAPRARRHQRPLARMDAEAAARDRPAADQRARRHHQLHHLRPRRGRCTSSTRQGRRAISSCAARATGESVLALDGKTYALDESMVVIADDARRRIASPASWAASIPAATRRRATC